MKKLIAGNWKMNGSLATNEALLTALAQGLVMKPACDVAVCVPAPYLAQVLALRAAKLPSSGTTAQVSIIVHSRVAGGARPSA